ncbi:MAG: histidine phosphatase family protein [Acidimicrobiales bacterium]
MPAPESPTAAEFRQLRFERPPGATSLLLVRHGESEPARPGVPFDLVDGQGDPDLDPIGEDQARRVAARLASEPIVAIFASTLRRTSQTARPLAGVLGLDVVVDAGLREVHLGEWEGGLFRQRVGERHPVAQRMVEEERWDVIPGAEPLERFSARVRATVEGIASRHADQTVAVFTHGGFIAQALAAATGSRRFAFAGVDNASLSHLVVTADRWVLRCFNDVAHLYSGFADRSDRDREAVTRG